MNLGTMVAGAGVTEAGAPPHLPPLDFEDLVHRFGPRLLAVARRLLRSEEDARDAVQDGFVAAFRSMGGFQGHSSPETWLHRIVVNAALMRLRSRRRHPETSVEDLLPGFLEDGHHERHIHDWPESPESAPRPP